MTTNRDSWRRATVAACVFIAWTVSTFMCHESGKRFLLLSERALLAVEPDSLFYSKPFQRFCLAFILTTVQCASCLLLVSPGSDNASIPQSRILMLLMSSHGLATLITNYSMTYIEASSTLAIKLTEPVIMAVAHHVVSQTPVPGHTAISIPIIIAGAVVFTDLSAQRNLSNLAGVLLAFTSNGILSARNLGLKTLHDVPVPTAAMRLKPLSRVALVVVAEAGLVGLMAFLQKTHRVADDALVLFELCLASGILHVMYSYISTNIVLKVMNVVSHSIANIFKRFLVVLLLCMAGSRHITALNFVGLCISLCGLLVYTQGKKAPETQPKGQDHETARVGTEISRGKLYLFVGLLALAAVSVVASTWRIEVLRVHQKEVDTKDDSKHREGHTCEEYQDIFTQFSHAEEEETDPKMSEFLRRRLVEIPEDTDTRAKTLTDSKQVVEEAQRILGNLLLDLLGKAKHVMLIEIATYGNKGDAAVAVGEIMLLRRLNVSVVFYCSTASCTGNTILQEALDVNKQYAKDELVLLLQGGGNLVGYPHFDKVREQFITGFPDRRIIMFSQSIWLRPDNEKQLEYPKRLYSNRSNLVMFLRDRQSLEIARANFKGVRLILAPDMAFCIGMVPRQLPPIYDIIWLQRDDPESSKYALPSFPANISVEVNDWYNWHSNTGQTDMESVFLILSEGFQFLQRGRIVVTDRLHGHILSILMNIPHVLIDNPPFLKLSTFERSWTASLQNTILVSNGSLALEAAMELLRTYHNSLPSVGPKDMYVGFNGNARKWKV